MRFFERIKSLFKSKIKKREVLIWCRPSSGKNQIGRQVNINGRKGKVVEGNQLSITVEWDN